MSQALGAPPEPSGHTPGLTCSLLLSWEHRPPGPWWPPGPRPSEQALWVRAVLWGPLQSRGSTAGPEGPRLAARSQGCHLRPSSVWGRAPHVGAGHPHRHMGWLPPASCGSQDRGEPACVCGRAPGPPGSGRAPLARPRGRLPQRPRAAHGGVAGSQRELLTCEHGTWGSHGPALCSTRQRKHAMSFSVFSNHRLSFLFRCQKASPSDVIERNAFTGDLL